MDLTWVGLMFLWLVLAPVIGFLCGTIPNLWNHDGRDMTPHVLFGVSGGCLAAWASWYPMAAARRQLARTLKAGIDRFAADYPRLVEAWGGWEVLKSPEAVAALLRTIDSGRASRPGFFRRLFGG